MSPNDRRGADADMGLRIDVIADTSWAAEGLSAALQRGTLAAADSGPTTPDALIVQAMPLDHWLAENSVSRHAPEIVVALLPDASFGTHVLQRLPVDTPVLWLHSTTTDTITTDGLSNRPMGSLPITASDAQLAAAIHALAQGLSVSLPATDHPHAAAATSILSQELAEPLTARELEVLELMAKGLANREIAAALGISVHTAKFHVAQILEKTGSATRTEAVRQGLRLGLIGL
jgi:DNA-binding NarL/FixJ family response regulator